MAGVYISYPFCAQKCTYCNFASGVFPAALEGEYFESLVAEIRGTEWPWTPETVYLGGGTPSQMDPGALGRLLEAIPGRGWREATIEAAPGGITAEKAEAWARAGINRVSLGVQSFAEAELRGTGRRHTAGIVEREVETLRASGISNISVDLISGLPNQTGETWADSLDWVRRLEVPHASVYMLEVDEDSRLGLEILDGGTKYGAGRVPREEEIAEFYERAADRMAEHGLERYEISNFARAGYESVHNLKYWRLEPYLGFGADAHSYREGRRWRNEETPAQYVARMRKEGTAVVERTAAVLEEEYFFLGLRQMEGVEAEPGRIAPYREAVERLVEMGLVEYDGRRLRLTRRGVLLSNDVFEVFIHTCPASSI
ncbi:MAG: coproporphyrinogen III oxidase [Candidatus Solibacter sp.]|nr:coproporphyrinogen III oxidase [Candidatus Solibacter sp.]